jgi:hypothetical protein
MAGRAGTRRVLSGSLEALLLANASSLTLLEARAGFGKSKITGELVQVRRCEASAKGGGAPPDRRQHCNIQRERQQ